MSFLQGAFLHCHRLMMLAHDNACMTSATTEATNSVPIPTTPVYPSHRWLPQPPRYWHEPIDGGTLAKSTLFDTPTASAGTPPTAAPSTPAPATARGRGPHTPTWTRDGEGDTAECAGPMGCRAFCRGRGTYDECFGWFSCCRCTDVVERNRQARMGTQASNSQWGMSRTCLGTNKTRRWPVWWTFRSSLGTQSYYMSRRCLLANSCVRPSGVQQTKDAAKPPAP